MVAVRIQHVPLGTTPAPLETETKELAIVNQLTQFFTEHAATAERLSMALHKPTDFSDTRLVQFINQGAKIAGKYWQFYAKVQAGFTANLVQITERAYLLSDTGNWNWFYAENAGSQPNLHAAMPQEYETPAARTEELLNVLSALMRLICEGEARALKANDEKDLTIRRIASQIQSIAPVLQQLA